MLPCLSAALCNCGESECATGSPKTPRRIGGFTSRVVSCHSRRSASVYFSFVPFVFIWRGTRCRAPENGRDGARPSNSISFRSELGNRTIESFQNALFSHDFEHVIKAWPDTPAADCDAGGMNQIARFTPDLLRQLF